MSGKRISAVTLKKIREDFMNYVPISTLAVRYKVARSSINHHVTRGWEEERNLLRAELYETLSSSKQVDFNNITGNAISILKKSLANLANRKQSPTLKEALDASKILDVLDKITRLDEGNPTDIISNNDKTIEIIDLKKKMVNDPFYTEPKAIEDKSE